MKRILIMAVLITILALSLSACDLYSYNYQENVLEYAMIAESGDLAQLEQYPNLEYVDLRGSTCYDEILAYAGEHPEVTVRYNVTFGEKRFDAEAAEVSLKCSDTDYDTLLENLKYLPDLQSVHLDQVTFTREQMDALTASYPNVTFTYTVELCERRYDHTVTELDLSYLRADDITDAANVLSLLSDLTSVELPGYGSNGDLTVGDVKMLVDACPGIAFSYEFNLFGQTVSTLAEELVFDTVEIGNDGVEKIREALGIMKNCTYVKLDSCEIDNEVMAQLRDDYPDITVAWRVFAGKFSILTDEEMLRMPISLKDSDATYLKYCNKIKYLDVQSSRITNIDFISYMPELECAVLTQTNIKDLSPLANCPNLTWLEISSCLRVNDLSTISDLQNLKYLNISNTRVTDLTVLDEMPLERFNCVKASVKDDELEAFIAKHPDCDTVSKGYALGYGWRYEDKQQTQMFPYYAQMYDIFRYGEKGFNGNKKEN